MRPPYFVTPKAYFENLGYKFASDEEFVAWFSGNVDAAREYAEAAEEAAAEAGRKAAEAETEREAAAARALDAEAWAAGTRSGEDVPEDDPAYAHNAAYYAGQMQQTAQQVAGRQTVMEGRLDAQDARIAEIRQQVTNPFVVAASGAEMTDQTKGYVYAGDGTGDDDGLIPGAAYALKNGELVMISQATDPNLVVSGVPADAAAVGEELSLHAPWFVDEYGSVFRSAYEKYLHDIEMGDSPEYRFTFGDLDKKRYKSDGTIINDGVSNMSHPIPYDDSMVLTVNRYMRDSTTYIAVVFIDESDEIIRFVGYEVHDGQEKRLNLERLSTWDENANIRVVIQTNVNEQSIITDWISVTRARHDIECYPLVHLLNDNIADFHPSGTKIPQYFSSNGKTVIRGGWKYLYGYGLPVDAEFFDYGGEVIKSSENGLGEYDLTKLYSTCISIPPEAYSFRFAVYGLVQFSSSVFSLGANLGKVLYRVGAYGAGQVHVAVNGLYTGRTVANALKLLHCRYNARQTNMRHYRLNALEGSSKNTGFPYGSRTLNYSVSYYSAMTMMSKGRGYNISTDPVSYNYILGFQCVTFIGEAVGVIRPYQGVEWWIQNYANNFEEIDGASSLYPGDLVLTCRYKRGSDGKFRLSTHLALIADVISDTKNGGFGGYLVLESGNCWTQKTAKTAGQLLWPVTDSERATDPGAVSKTWRFRMPLTHVPIIGTNYTFEKDQELDPINHPENVVAPPVIGPMGDMTLIGPGRNGWGSIPTILFLYTDKDVQYIEVYKDGDYAGRREKSQATETSSCLVFNAQDLFADDDSAHLYQIYADGDRSKPCTLYNPEFPTAISSEDGKTATVSGIIVSTQDGKLKLKTASFDDLYFRVIPWPVQNICGYQPRYANYLNIKAEDIWDGEKFDVGDQYQYIVALTAVNRTYGSAMIWFRGDHDIDSMDDEDRPDGDAL